MNKIIRILSIFGISILISNCTEEQYLTEEYVPATQTISLSGTVQKGPFVNGTSITISELDSALIQTGHTFFTQITNDKGSFEVDLELESNFVMLRADGFYFNEVSGKTSTSQITLYALSDITDSSTVNVNILSHLEKPRVEFLISEGISFAEAKKQAQSEVLSVFNIEKDDIRSSELLDISQAGDDNAALLATSIILQGFRSEGELSELLSNISLDLKEDGTLDDEKLGARLINHARLNINSETRSNIENRYTELGVEFEIGSFEKYISSFVENTSFEYDNFITYPKETYRNEIGDQGINLLHEDNNVVYTYNPENQAAPKNKYYLHADLDKGHSIKIILSKDNSCNLYSGFGYNYWSASTKEKNWTYSTYSGPDMPNGHEQIFEAKYSGGDQIALPIYFNSFLEDECGFKLDVYENNSLTPTFSKILTVSKTSS